jgi:hypothetical protein
MNKGVLALLIPILALTIPVVAIIFSGLAKMSRTRLEEARIRAGSLDPSGELQALRDEVDELRREVGELNERVDFAERLLAKSADRERLPKPS